MRVACTGARSKPSSPADQLALSCSAGRDAAANLARFGAHDPGQIPVRLFSSVRAEPFFNRTWVLAKLSDGSGDALNSLPLVVCRSLFLAPADMPTLPTGISFRGEDRTWRSNRRFANCPQPEF